MKTAEVAKITEVKDRVKKALKWQVHEIRKKAVALTAIGSLLFSNYEAHASLIIGKTLSPEDSYAIAKEMHYSLVNSKSTEYYIMRGIVNLYPQISSEEYRNLVQFFNRPEIKPLLPQIAVDNQQRILIVSPVKTGAKPLYLRIENFNIDNGSINITSNLLEGYKSQLQTPINLVDSITNSLFSALLNSAVAGDELGNTTTSEAGKENLQLSKLVSTLQNAINEVHAIKDKEKDQGSITRGAQFVAKQSATSIIRYSWKFPMYAVLGSVAALLALGATTNPLTTVAVGAVAATAIGLAGSALVAGKLILDSKNVNDDASFINLEHYLDECNTEYSYMTEKIRYCSPDMINSANSAESCNDGSNASGTTLDDKIKNIFTSLTSNKNNSSISSHFTPGLFTITALAEGIKTSGTGQDESNQITRWKPKMSALQAIYPTIGSNQTYYQIYKNQMYLRTGHMRKLHQLQEDGYLFHPIDYLRDQFNIVKNDLWGSSVNLAKRQFHSKLKVQGHGEERMVAQLHHIIEELEKGGEAGCETNIRARYNSMYYKVKSIFSNDLNKKIQTICKGGDQSVRSRLLACHKNIKNYLTKAAVSCNGRFNSHFKEIKGNNHNPWDLWKNFKHTKTSALTQTSVI